MDFWVCTELLIIDSIETSRPVDVYEMHLNETATVFQWIVDRFTIKQLFASYLTGTERLAIDYLLLIDYEK